MRAALHFWVTPQIAFHRPQPFHPPARTADLPVEGPPGRCRSVPSALARGYPLAQGLGNPPGEGGAGAGVGAVPRLDAGHIRQEEVGRRVRRGSAPT
jgi:hypothetical protein